MLYEVITIYPNAIENFKIDVTYHNIQRLIGKELPKETIKTILQGLEIGITAETEVGLSLSVPPYRVDVLREADIIEELLRVYGYNNIEMPETVNSTIVYRITSYNVCYTKLLRNRLKISSRLLSGNKSPSKPSGFKPACSNASHV